MSDTPRTDAGYVAHYAHHDENRNLCCELERELAAERKRAAEAERMLSIGTKCDECGCSFKGPPCLFVKSGWCKHNEERAMDKTPGKIAVDAAFSERWIIHPKAAEIAVAAVIAHVTPQIRVAAIEDARGRMLAMLPMFEASIDAEFDSMLTAAKDPK